MKIIHVGAKGGDVRMRRAARLQRDQGHDVTLVMGCIHSMEEPALLRKKEDADNFPWFQINQRRPGNLRAELAALRPDILHVHELDMLFYTTAVWTPEANERLLDEESVRYAGFDFASMPCPIVYDTHEYEQGRAYHYANQITLAEQAWKERVTIPYADAVIAPSPAIATRLRGDYFLRDMPTVVLNAPFAPIRAPNIHRDGVRAHFKVREGDKVLGFVGHVTRDRMLRQLGRAFAKLGEGWRLWIMGSTEDMDLRAELDSYGAEFLGVFPYPWPDVQEAGRDLPALNLYDGIAACDVMFAGSDIRGWPSWRMAAPNKFFEYAMSGVPQVMSEMHDPLFWAEQLGCGVSYNQTVGGLVEAIQRAKDLTFDREAIVRLFAYETQAIPLGEAYVTAFRRYAERTHGDLRSEPPRLAHEAEHVEQAQ